MEPILKVRDLSISFTQYTKGLRQREISVVKNLNIESYPGEVLAILGASGSGKSLLAHAIFGILPSNARMSGEILFEGEPLTEKKLRKLRGNGLAFIPQTVNSLDPLMKVGKQVQYSVKDGDKVKSQKNAFARYGLKPEVGEYYPFQLSGGMARRVLVSTAMLNDARLIVADEPTPGMDPESIDETLSNIRELVDDGSSVMVIIHDIETALKIADRIAILYDGTVIETAKKEAFHGKGEELKHPYSRALWNALPQNGFHVPENKELLNQDSITISDSDN